MNAAANLACSARRLTAVSRRQGIFALLIALAAAAMLANPQAALAQGFGFFGGGDPKQVERMKEALDKQIQELGQQVDKLQSKQIDLRAKVRNQSGLSPENVKPMLLNLERERFTLEIESKLKLARREQLARLIAEETVKAGDQIDRDEVTEHLKKIVQSRKDLLQIKKRDTTDARVANVSAAEAELAEAEVRLAMRKQELLKSRTGAGVEQLNLQLQAVSLEVAQDALRLELLKERLDALGKTEGVLDAYKATGEVELPRMLRLLEQSQTQKGQLEFGGGGFGGGGGFFGGSGGASGGGRGN